MSMLLKKISSSLCLYTLFMSKILGQGISLTFNLLLWESVVWYPLSYSYSHTIFCQLIPMIANILVLPLRNSRTTEYWHFFHQSILLTVLALPVITL